MKKSAIAAVLAAALAAPIGAAPVTDWKVIDKTLAKVPTAAGVSLKQRLKNCKIVAHKDTSWMETRDVPWRDYGAKPGETVVKLLLDMPPAPKQPGPVKPNPPQTNVPVIFLIDKNGKASPISSWANALLNRPVPLGYDASNNC